MSSQLVNLGDSQLDLGEHSKSHGFPVVRPDVGESLVFVGMKLPDGQEENHDMDLALFWWNFLVVPEAGMLLA